MKQYLDSIQPENEALVEVILTAGEILIKANAEAYRIEDSLKRMFTAYKCQADIIAQSTSLIATIRFPDQQTITVIRRVNEHQTNLNHVHTDQTAYSPGILLMGNILYLRLLMRWMNCLNH